MQVAYISRQSRYTSFPFGGYTAGESPGKQHYDGIISQNLIFFVRLIYGQPSRLQEKKWDTGCVPDDRSTHPISEYAEIYTPARIGLASLAKAMGRGLLAADSHRPDPLERKPQQPAGLLPRTSWNLAQLFLGGFGR